MPVMMSLTLGECRTQAYVRLESVTGVIAPLLVPADRFASPPLVDVWVREPESQQIEISVDRMS
jgi:hypothetical protein